MGGCSVAGCRNRFARGKLHFYRFPKDYRKDLWIQFTSKNNFQPKASSTICEVHFTKDCFVEKKDRVHLSKDAVPTILFNQEVPYDAETHQYDQGSLPSLRGNISVEDEATIIKKRQQKLDDLKAMCRFCLSLYLENERNNIPISQLEAYKIDQNEVVMSLNLPLNDERILGERICEQCFQTIVEYDLFKKKCREAQEDFFAEISELDAKINEIQSNKTSKVWYKNEAVLSDNQPIEIFEEHLEDENFGEGSFQQLEVSEFIEEIHDGYKIVTYRQTVPESILSDEKILKGEISEKDETTLVIINEALNENMEAEDDQQQEGKDKSPPQGVDEYKAATTDEIIKNPSRNRFCFRIYECFFCKMKFAGRKTYVAHKCPVSEVKCELCDKVFNKIQSYNSHVSHVHGSLPISKHFCPLCKTVIMSTLHQFKSGHRRECYKQNQMQEIECEVCSKVCNSLKGYTIHKLFHDTRNFTSSTGEKIVSEGLNTFKGVICELCGKDFQSQVGLRMHRRNVHRIGQAEGETFQCHICTKICPTKRSLFDHTRNTHRVQESACNICGKVFRTRVLLKKHSMYHDETKRVFKCNLCPDKNGYFTKVALKRHQKSHSTIKLNGTG